MGIEDYGNFDEDGNADPDKVIYSYDVHSDDEGVTANSWGGYTINIQKLKDYVSAHGYRFQAGLVGNERVQVRHRKAQPHLRGGEGPQRRPAAPTATDVAQAKVTVRSASDATKSRFSPSPRAPTRLGTPDQDRLGPHLHGRPARGQAAVLR